MRTLLMAVLFFGLFSVMPGLALAQCQTIVIFDNGQYKTCTICTDGGLTTITCF